METIRKVSEVALGVEATKRQAAAPGRTAQRRPGVVSLVMWAKPPAAVARSQGGGGAKVRDMRGAWKKEKAAGGGQPDLSRFHAGCLLSPFCWESGLRRVSSQPQDDDDTGA